MTDLQKHQATPATSGTTSEMRQRFDSFDWGMSPLGPRENWPNLLKATVNTMLLSPVPSFIVWGNAAVHLYNDAFLSTLGVRHPEAFGRAFDEIWGRSWPGAQEMITSAFNGRSFFREEVGVHLNPERDKEITYLSFVISPIADERNDVRGAQCTVRDTTANTVLLAEERSKIQALKDATRLAPGFVAIFSGPDHIVEMGNDAYMKLVAHRRVIGKPLRIAIPEAVEQGWVALLDQVFKTGEPAVGKGARYLSKEAGTLADKEHFIDYVFQPVRGTGAGTTAIFFQGNDVTESVVTHRALLSSEQEMRQLANTIPQLAWVAEPDGNRFWFNERWFEYTGTTLEQMQDWGWKSVVDEEALPRVIEEWKASLDTGVPFEDTFPLRGSDGKFRTFYTRAVPLIDDDGRITKWFGTNTDITEIEEARHALQQSNRRKDEFLAMLAHELRNPLAPVATAAELLKMGGGDEARVKKASDIIARQVKHMTRLIDDLLDVSRVTRGQVTLRPELVAIREIVLPAIEQVQPLLVEKSHRFSLQMPDENVSVRVDKARLIQVIANLLNNAAKYTDPQGRIALKVSASETKVTVSVSDNGIGVTPELMPQIFDLFSQGERSSARSQGGLGLGLALVKSLVELSGGTVSAISEGAHEGSTFTVAIPQVFETVLPKLFHPHDVPQLTRSDALCILVVDDNIDAVETLSIFLRAVGHDVSTAYNGREALLAAQNATFDVMFLDIGLPDIDGYALARRLRMLPQMVSSKVVAITGYGQASDKERTKEAGFDHHLVKPVSLTQVLEVIGVRS